MNEEVIMGHVLPHRVMRHTVLVGQSHCTQCALRPSTLFGCLPVEVLEDIHAPIEHLSLPPKAALYREGDPGRFIYTVRSGLLKLVQRAPNGISRIVGLLRQGDAAGLGALGGFHYLHGAEALYPTEVCRIPVEVVRDFRTRYPSMTEQILIRQQKCLESSNEIITLLSTGTAQGRVVRCVLHTLSEAGANSCPAMSREDMAAMTSVTVETVSRIIAEFKRQGLLTEYRGRFSFDRDALMRFAEE